MTATSRRQQRAVRREKRRLLADPELRARRDSYLMTYGPDWPPAPEPAEPKHAPMTLAQRCGAVVVLFALIWAAGALVLHALHPQSRGTVIVWQDDTPARGHATDVTTTLPPHPATHRSHP